jgi:hypothetical protein
MRKYTVRASILTLTYTHFEGTSSRSGLMLHKVQNQHCVTKSVTLLSTPLRVSKDPVCHCQNLPDIQGAAA